MTLLPELQHALVRAVPRAQARSRRRRRTVTLAALALLLLAVAGGAVAATNVLVGGRELDTSPPVPAIGNAANGASPQLARAIALFARRRTRADDIPLPAGQRLPRNVIPRSVLHALTLSDGTAYWLALMKARSQSLVCVLIRTGPRAPIATACGPVTQRFLLAGTVADVSFGGPDGIHVAGIAPGPSRHVTANNRDGTTTEIPVHGNFFAARLAKPINGLTWQGPAGKVIHLTPSYLPPGITAPATKRRRPPA